MNACGALVVPAVWGETDVIKLVGVRKNRLGRGHWAGILRFLWPLTLGYAEVCMISFSPAFCFVERFTSQLIADLKSMGTLFRN